MRIRFSDSYPLEATSPPTSLNGYLLIFAATIGVRPRSMAELN
jgi:hypothetical protein